MNIAFIGSNNYFSSVLFQRLLQHIPLRLLVLPGIKSPVAKTETRLLNLQSQHSFYADTEHIALQSNTPISYQTGHNYSQLALDLAEPKIDISIIACYPFLLPESIVSASRFGAINIHPSLLPKYRGPSPIFWQLKNNQERIGLSLHCINKHFDAGNIIKQIEVDIPIGANGNEINDAISIAANNLLVEILTDSDNLATHIASASTQDEAQASYFGAPQRPEDFNISLDWHAEHVFRFMRGTQHWQSTYSLESEKIDIKLISAISYSNDHLPQATLLEENNIVNIAFKTGFLRAYYQPGR